MTEGVQTIKLTDKQKEGLSAGVSLSEAMADDWRGRGRVSREVMSESFGPNSGQRRTSTAYALAYAVAMPHLQEVARNHGYALAVHGSMATDLDLIAVPWVESASEPGVLIEAIRECVGGMYDGGDEPVASVRLHGRRSYTILPSNLFLGVPKLPWSPWLDISVMPKVPK